MESPPNMVGQIESAAVIGPDGFIGQNFVDRLKADGIAVFEISRDTPACDLPKEGVDCVFFCAGNSATYRTRENPDFCLRRNIVELHEYLTELEYQRFVHLSSCAVYPPESDTKQSTMSLDPRDVSLYGAHKLLSERYVTEFADRWIILRPAYLYGPGLWKNILYDLRTAQEHVFLNPDSRLSILDVRHLADAALTLVQQVENKVFNVASEHLLSVRELLQLAPDEYSLRDERYINHSAVDLTNLHQYWQEPYSEQTHRERIQAFLERGEVNQRKGL